jgi:hypothetical protein
LIVVGEPNILLGEYFASGEFFANPIFIAGGYFIS